MTSEEREKAIEYIKSYRKLDENLHNTAPRGTVSFFATEKCLNYWDMAIKSLEQEPCEDAISRAEAIRIASGYCHFTTVPKELEKLPPVTPQPKMGRWITNSHGFPPEATSVCSECGFDRDFYIRIRGFDKIKYCPNCGAKMQENKE